MTPARPVPGTKLTVAAGWLATAFGIAHTVAAPIDVRGTWPEVLRNGWWNQFTLDRPTTVDEYERSEAFWLTIGSFGVPMALFGSYIVWSARQRHRVPGWIGWVVLGWGTALSVLLPLSPGWVLPVVGGLIIAGDRRSISARLGVRAC